MPRMPRPTAAVWLMRRTRSPTSPTSRERVPPRLTPTARPIPMRRPSPRASFTSRFVRATPSSRRAGPPQPTRRVPRAASEARDHRGHKGHRHCNLHRQGHGITATPVTSYSGAAGILYGTKPTPLSKPAQYGIIQAADAYTTGTAYGGDGNIGAGYGVLGTAVGSATSTAINGSPAPALATVYDGGINFVDISAGSGHSYGKTGTADGGDGTVGVITGSGTGTATSTGSPSKRRATASAPITSPRFRVMPTVRMPTPALAPSALSQAPRPICDRQCRLRWHAHIHLFHRLRPEGHSP